MVLASQQSAGAGLHVTNVNNRTETFERNRNNIKRSEIHVEYETILVQSVTGN
jgi:hypothetical protein